MSGPKPISGPAPEWALPIRLLGCDQPVLVCNRFSGAGWGSSVLAGPTTRAAAVFLCTDKSQQQTTSVTQGVPAVDFQLFYIQVSSTVQCTVIGEQNLLQQYTVPTGWFLHWLQTRITWITVSISSRDDALKHWLVISWGPGKNTCYRLGIINNPTSFILGNVFYFCYLVYKSEWYTCKPLFKRDFYECRTQAVQYCCLLQLHWAAAPRVSANAFKIIKMVTL